MTTRLVGLDCSPRDHSNRGITLETCSQTTSIATWLPFVRNGCLVVGHGDVEQAFQTSERVFTLSESLTRRSC